MMKKKEKKTIINNNNTGIAFHMQKTRNETVENDKLSLFAANRRLNTSTCDSTTTFSYTVVSRI